MSVVRVGIKFTKQREKLLRIYMQIDKQFMHDDDNNNSDKNVDGIWMKLKVKKKSYYDGKSIFLWHDKKENSLISNVFSMVKKRKREWTEIVAKETWENFHALDAKESEHPLFIYELVPQKPNCKSLQILQLTTEFALRF